MRDLKVPGVKLGRRGEVEVEIKDNENLDLGKLLIEADELSN